MWLLGVNSSELMVLASCIVNIECGPCVSSGSIVLNLRRGIFIFQAASTRSHIISVIILMGHGTFLTSYDYLSSAPRPCLSPSWHVNSCLYSQLSTLVWSPHTLAPVSCWSKELLVFDILIQCILIKLVLSLSDQIFSNSVLFLGFFTYHLNVFHCVWG